MSIANAGFYDRQAPRQLRSTVADRLDIKKEFSRMNREPGPDAGVQDNETVTELTYRFDLRRSAFFIQPDFQYFIQPGGTGRLKDAPVLDAQFGIFF
jgi:carbohydrate-selective porin OprB